ncbi:MAG: YIP1 family protein [Deltaproteobacteria bacterium]|nr:YIP1 family protein [Deltaproteobacteria bacterium]
MSQCSRCLLDLEFHSSLDGGFCPNCGLKPDSVEAPVASGSAANAGLQGAAPVGPGVSFVLFSRFWQSVREIIFTPTNFFSANAAMLLSDESLSTALAFAVIIQWLASFFNFLWRTVIGTAIESRMDDFFRIAGDVMQNSPGTSETLEQLRRHTIEFLFGAGAIVLTPFTTLLKLAFSALLVHAAVRFFMKDSPERRHSYSTTLKILAFATAPWILCVVPGVGILLAYVLGFGAAVIGIREVYSATTGRAVLAVLFPELLLIAFVAGIGVFFLFLAFNVLRLVF